MAPQIEVLKHHGQTGTQQAQLVFIRDFKLAVFVAHQANIFVIDHDSAFTRFFEEVNAAQKGTFTRA